jgi:hypothetical protein
MNELICVSYLLAGILIGVSAMAIVFKQTIKELKQECKENDLLRYWEDRK